YHWGYHVVIAAAMQLSGVSLVPTILWSGQALNALQALVAAALAAYLWRKPLPGVVAAIVVGLLSIMPAYYVSWGRYTQLTGLLLLPSLMIAWHSGLRAPTRARMLCLAVLLAGLSLIHFRVLMFALAFVAASGGVWLYLSGRSGLWARVRFGAFAAALSLVLSAPWLWVIAQRTLLPAISRPSNLVPPESYSALTPGLLWAGHNRILIALALAAALWGVARRKPSAVELVVWVAAMALMANPVLVGLPYFWLITNDVFVISLFLPVGVLLGGGTSALLEKLQLLVADNRRRSTHGEAQKLTIEDRKSGMGMRSSIFRSTSPSRRRLAVGGVALALLGAIAVWGAFDLRRVINPGTVLATRADLAAITWAAEHTPPDARFLIGATPWLGSYRGVDGGWWLLPLAGRWVSTPPVLFVYGAPEYVGETRATSKFVSSFRAGQEQQLLQLIEREQITYVYLSKRSAPLPADLFANNPAFVKVYERDDVTILAIH
ncbi:MAG TPA: hypothetical protein VFX76_01345, partial [Roseiflexaceae bacterium]|nr:hypothetical protein [Roseiflexaceae bacterium]